MYVWIHKPGMFEDERMLHLHFQNGNYKVDRRRIKGETKLFTIASWKTEMPEEDQITEDLEKIHEI